MYLLKTRQSFLMIAAIIVILSLSTDIFSSGSKTLKPGRYAPTSKSAKMLKVASWNVRTMLDAAQRNRPKRRSALIAHELSRLNVDIAAFNKVCFPGEGSLQKHGSGYTLWSGKPTTEGRLSGVGFMVSISIASRQCYITRYEYVKSIYSYPYAERS